MECKVKQVLELGSHDLFLAEIVAVHVDSALLDEKKRLQLEKARLLAYSHGQYFGLGKVLGSFGFSVRKGEKKKSSAEKKQEKNLGKIREKRENRSFKKKKTGVKG